MRTVALLARKGGTGKTTLAVHLAVLASETGRRVLLVDTDPQRSAGDWRRARRGGSPQVIECAASRVPEILVLAADSPTEMIDLVVVDTRPSVEAGPPEIARLSDLVLIPTGPGILDLRAIAATVAMVTAIRTGATMVVLNGVLPPSGTSENALTIEARRALAGYRIPVADAALGRRVAFAHALIDGRSVTEFEPRGKAARELRQLFTQMETVLWPAAPP